MSRDYQSPDYSLEDLRLAIEAMCKSLEGSGLIDEHEHPSAYSALLDTAKWMAELEGQEPVAWMGFGPRDGRAEFSIKKPAGSVMRDFNMRPVFARPAPAEPVNARLLAVATGKIPHLYEGRCPDYVNGPESRDPDCPACQAIAAAEAQQERLLPVTVPTEPVNARLLTALKACRHKFAQYVAHHISKGDMHKAMANESMVAMADVAIMAAEAAPRAARLTHSDIAKALASAGLKPEDYREDGEILPLVVAIESAALRKNGLALED